MDDIKERLQELLNLDGYRDFESAEDLADGYNKLREIVKEYLIEEGK